MCLECRCGPVEFIEQCTDLGQIGPVCDKLDLPRLQCVWSIGTGHTSQLKRTQRRVDLERRFGTFLTQLYPHVDRPVVDHG